MFKLAEFKQFCLPSPKRVSDFSLDAIFEVS